jgi:hypothetical protein
MTLLEKAPYIRGEKYTEPTANTQYVTLDTDIMKNKLGEYYDVYVEQTDMAAVVPELTGNILPDGYRLYVDGNGIKTEKGGYAGFMTGYCGVCNSIYDLRELV